MDNMENEVTDLNKGKDTFPERLLLKETFLKEDNKRQEFLTRCEEYAGFTLPTHFPTNNSRQWEETQHDYQSVGAQVTLSLASKFMLGLFPPAKEFFHSDIDKETAADLIKAGVPAEKVDEVAARSDKKAGKLLDSMNARSVFTNGAIQLIITGNALLKMPEDGSTPLLFTVRDYVIKRDLSGNVLQIITREQIGVMALPEDLKAIALAKGYNEDDEIVIYTGIKRIGEKGKEKYKVTQELEDICKCANREGLYSKDTLEYIPLTWSLKRGQDYATGLVEDYKGDFHALSNMAESKVDYSVLLSDIKVLVNPAGTTDVQEYMEAQSGDAIYGREDDIFISQPQVGANLQAVSQEFLEIAQRIGKGFLHFNSTVRDAERVTAEEIQRISQELEVSLGGIYSTFAYEWQLPVAKRLLARVSNLLKGVQPTIVTGLDALSRAGQLNDLRAFLQDLSMLEQLAPETRMKLKEEVIIAMFGAGHGLEYHKFIKTEEEIEAEMAKMRQEQAQQVGQEEAAKTAGQQAPQQQPQQ